MKTIAVLGSTGSIGRQTLDVVRWHPDEFRVVALVAARPSEVFQAQVGEFAPALTCLTGTDGAARLVDGANAYFRERAKSDPVRYGGRASHDTLLCQRLAELYQAAGNQARAEPLFRQVLAVRRQALGERHLLVAKSSQQLAQFYATTPEPARLALHAAERRAIVDDDPW